MSKLIKIEFNRGQKVFYITRGWIDVGKISSFDVTTGDEYSGIVEYNINSMNNRYDYNAFQVDIFSTFEDAKTTLLCRAQNKFQSLTDRINNLVEADV